MLFDDLKGYATRDTAAKKLAEAIAHLPTEAKTWAEKRSLIVAAPAASPRQSSSLAAPAT